MGISETINMADTLIENISDASQLVSIGTRALAVKDYAKAVEAFGKASSILSGENGVTSFECARVYLSYAQALMYEWREELTLFETERNGTDNDSEEDEGEDDVQNSKACDEDNSTEGSTQKQNAEKQDDGDVTDDPTAKDISDIELAWEVLESARCYLEKQPDSPQDLLAEVLAALAEVLLNDDAPDRAKNELEKCLKLQQGMFEPNDRRIATTHFELGLANQIMSSFDEAIYHFEKACGILIKIRDLKKEADEAGAEEKYMDVKVEGLEDTISQILEKVEEIKVSKVETIKELKKTLMGPPSPLVAAETGASAGPAHVKNISHLVKRKRESEDNTNEPASKISK